MPVDAEECPSCHQKRGKRHKPTTARPDAEKLAEWEEQGVCEATDGCAVEPDGTCEHGHTSWMRVLEMI